MFDIGFTELLLIAVIALVVLGPERLPGAIRTTAYWISKIKRSFQSAKDELEKELDVEGIKRQIHNEQVMKELEKTRTQVTESIKEPLETLNKPIDLGDKDLGDKDPGEKDSGDKGPDGTKGKAQNETEEKTDKSI